MYTEFFMVSSYILKGIIFSLDFFLGQCTIPPTPHFNMRLAYFGIDIYEESSENRKLEETQS